MRRGVYGGTFNPVHLGHVKLAEAHREALALDRLMVIPTYLPPHKAGDGLVEGRHRLEMCRLAFAGDPAAEVSDLELRRGAKSYTVDTLEALTAGYPGDELYLLMGSDMFLTLTQWRSFERIFQLAVVCAGAREPGLRDRLEAHAALLRERYGARCRVIAFSPLPISSTLVRERAGRGEPLCGLVPPGVAEYIVANGLYAR